MCILKFCIINSQLRSLTFLSSLHSSSLCMLQFFHKETLVPYKNYNVIFTFIYICVSVGDDKSSSCVSVGDDKSSSSCPCSQTGMLLLI